MSYARVAAAEPSEISAITSGPPPNVVAAAHSLFEREHGRPAVSDAEALSFVQGMVASRAAAASAAASSQAASEGVPPNVVAAAHGLFERHHGRKPTSDAEAMGFASELVARTGFEVKTKVAQAADHAAAEASARHFPEDEAEEGDALIDSACDSDGGGIYGSEPQFKPPQRMDRREPTGTSGGGGAGPGGHSWYFLATTGLESCKRCWCSCCGGTATLKIDEKLDVRRVRPKGLGRFEDATVA